MKSKIYVSDSLFNFDKTALTELIDLAANRNREVGITGYLSFNKNRFFQYLEGPETAVEDVFRSIVNDRRHKIIKTLDLGELSQRRFSNWYMKDLSRADTKNIRMQDLIEDVMTSYTKNGLAETESRGLVAEMLEQMTKLHADTATHYSSSDAYAEHIGPTPPFVVALGASAGGLRPLQTIVKSLKPNPEVVLIVIQHFSPDSETMMDSILQRETSMPVGLADEGVAVTPGNIFVIPSGKDLEVQNGRFVLSKQIRAGRVPQFPIDICFKSIAREHGDRAVAVVLSGTGSDGSKGAIELNKAGGVVVAQSPETAEFDGMPKACIATEKVHEILAPIEIAEFINALSHDYVHDSLALWPSLRTDYVNEVVGLLEDKNFDFSQYKRETLFRRIERRRVMASVSTTGKYISLLRASPSERDELREDILITVTSFFRDTDAWDKLKESLIPLITTQMNPDETFRVWVAACSTGEEAYSVAIVLTELFESLDKPANYKIFATDIEHNALSRASSGCYNDRTLAQVSSERRKRFFVRKPEGYVIADEIRENVIFAPHNFVKNAPFTRMHLVTCRNVLIYMQPELQELAIKMLHFALHVNGVLFLGPAETLGNLQSEFQQVQREWNQYKKLRDLRLPLHLTNDRIQNGAHGLPSVMPAIKKSTNADSGIVGISLDALSQVSGHTNVLLDSARNVMIVMSDPTALLQVYSGQPTTDVTRMVPEELRASLTFAISRVFKESNPITHRKLKCTPTGQSERLIDMQVIPHTAAGEVEVQYALLILSDSAPAHSSDDVQLPEEDSNSIDGLRLELEETKKALQAAINDLESSNNEQRSANEQLSAANEELQSTNEELQSVNEELYTVNFEYQAKIHELSELNQDLDNLLDSTRLGVIFLDTNLCIRRFTDVATQTVKLLPSDVGRPFVDLAHNLQYTDLVDDMRRVLSIGKSISREISRNDVDQLQVGIHPYRADDGVAHGVLVTLRDIRRTAT